MTRVFALEGDDIQVQSETRLRALVERRERRDARLKAL